MFIEIIRNTFILNYFQVHLIISTKNRFFVSLANLSCVIKVWPCFLSFMWFYLWWCSKHASLHCICFKKTAKLPRKSIILRATLAYKLLWLLRIIQVFKRILEKDWKIFVLTSPSARHALVLFVELDISWSPILHNFLIFFNLWTSLCKFSFGYWFCCEHVALKEGCYTCPLFGVDHGCRNWDLTQDHLGIEKS